MVYELSKREKAEIFFSENFSKNQDNFNPIYTPLSLCEEILDKIEITQNQMFCVMYNFEFVFTLKNKYNIPAEQIVLWTLEYSDLYYKTSKTFGCNYLFGNFTKEELGMKFDVVLGNPPYQNTHSAKRWPLWHQFMSKAIDISDVVAFVVPSSLIGPGKAFDEIKNHTVYLNLDVKQHFKVGSTFCYFIYDNLHVGNTVIRSENNEHLVNISDKSFLPSIINEHTLSLFNKLSNKPKRIWKRGEFHTANNEWKTESGIPVFHTNAQTLYTNDAHPNIKKIRVVVTLAGYPKFKVIQNQGCSQGTFWTEFNSLEEAQECANRLNGKEAQEILSVFKWSGWNRNEIISLL